VAARIHVLAGVNGAGKSSVGGAALRAAGADYYNPDEVTRRLVESGHDPVAANSLAWVTGRELLERAIRLGTNYAFETTLGGNTITRLLQDATESGHRVFIWYVGLASAEQHVARVAARVKGGGHSIREDLIRHRFDRSRLNLIALMRSLTELRVYDNSVEADPAAGIPPKPCLLLHLDRGVIIDPPDLSRTPDWARPIVATALRLSR
jgi:predicted ABC-type ATPase